jgi:integrase/recombinase XerD
MITTNTPATLEEHPTGGPLDGAIASFLDQLHTAGYVKKSLRDKRTVVRTFTDWLRRKHIAVDAIDESQIAAFLTRTSGTLPRRLKYKRAALSGFLKYLRGVGMISARAPRAPSAGDDLITEYVKYLRHDRGLAPNSVLVYVPFIRDWLKDHIARTGGVSMDGFDAATVQSFLLDHTRNRSREYARLLATALRSFFRFLFLRGHRSTDLSRAVPTVCTCRNATVPAFLSPEDVDRVLAATDQSTAVGRRDYAILLLLARLGLRAGEVASLELNDIHWRTGELVIRGKGRVVEHLPLLADVGDGLAQYLRERRSASASRRVFLRSCPPYVGLAGPSAIGDIVCARLAHANVQRSGRGAAHLFRHGLATHMIRHGASLAEIAQVLRHRSQTTTTIYTHLSFEALRAVARPWPTAGGDR